MKICTLLLIICTLYIVEGKGGRGGSSRGGGSRGSYSRQVKLCVVNSLVVIKCPKKACSEGASCSVCKRCLKTSPLGRIE